MSAHIAGLDSHAPTELVAAADATWNGDLDLYGMLLTCFGVAVMHSVKKIGLVVDSSHESEAIASAKAGELVAYAREVLVALGAPPTGPTVILSDNKANVLVANNAKSASRSRHTSTAPLPHAAAPHGRGRVPRRQDHRRPHARRFLDEMGPQGEAQAQRRPRLQRASSRGALGFGGTDQCRLCGPSPPSDIGGGAVGRHSTSHLTAPTLSWVMGRPFTPTEVITSN